MTVGCAAVSALGLVDADCHIAEPADLWTSRVPSRWIGSVPEVRRDAEGGREWWWIGDRRGPSATDGCFGRDADARAHEPLSLADVDPVCLETGARVAMMDTAGVAAEVLYPNLVESWALLLSVRDPVVRLVVARAYNDFVADWTSAARHRFATVAVLPFWDVDASVAEIGRAAQLGHKALLFNGAPQDYYLPFLSSTHWDPVWAAAQDARLSVSLHVTAGNPQHRLTPARVIVEGEEATYARASTDMLLNSAHHLNDLLLSGVLARFPDLRFVLVESGIGWIPFCLEACDHHFVRGNVRDSRPELSMLPSEYFRRQVSACYWFESTGPVRLLDVVGADNVMFETDFPHPTSIAPDDIWPTLEASLVDQPDSVRRKIVAENAAQLYGLELE